MNTQTTFIADQKKTKLTANPKKAAPPLFEVELGVVTFNNIHDELFNYVSSSAREAFGSHRVAGWGRKFSLDALARIWPVVVDRYCDNNEPMTPDAMPDSFIELGAIIGNRSEEMRKDLEDKISRGSLEFEDLPIYFGAGQKVVFMVSGREVGGVVFKSQINRTFFGAYFSASIKCLHTLHGDVSEGEVEGYEGEFVGLKPISDLRIRLADEDDIKRLTDRGLALSKLMSGPTYMSYKGQLTRSSWRGSNSFRADGRVMIDAKTFASVDNDGHSNETYASGFRERNSEKTRTKVTLREEDLWRTYPFVWGFSFAAKTWGAMAIDGLSDIAWRGNAFDQLVLPENEKALVKAVVENSQGSFEDIVDGKGGGFVFLLHGPPGQGKTLTAETVAEALNKPLYSVSVGELGTNPDQLEERLRKILDVAVTWDAVLLLDEADIFLEARNEDDVIRNAMVGVFLRLLEYHQGVLFLTTNRVKNIDEAFYSRISVPLGFEEATASKRQRIWANLLGAAKITGLDAERLSAFDLNGRQIKNTIRLAQTLARSRSEPVDEKHITEVVDLIKAFKPHG